MSACVLIKSFFGRQILHLIWENLNSFILSLNYIYALLSIVFVILIIFLLNYKNIINFLAKDRVSSYFILIFFVISFMNKIINSILNVLNRQTC